MEKNVEVNRFLRERTELCEKIKREVECENAWTTWRETEVEPVLISREACLRRKEKAAYYIGLQNIMANTGLSELPGDQAILNAFDEDLLKIHSFETCHRCKKFQLTESSKNGSLELSFRRKKPPVNPCNICGKGKKKSASGFYYCPDCIEKLGYDRKTALDNLIQMYGGKCEICGISRDDAMVTKNWRLVVHHLNMDGKQEREKYGQAHFYYKKIILEGVQHSKYQLLCPSCHTKEHGRKK